MEHDSPQRPRQSIRLPGYDYAQPGTYFVTLCTHQRALLFGDVASDRVALNACGRIAETGWRAIPRHFPAVELDAFVIMPNHIHGLVVITVGATHSPASGRLTDALGPACRVPLSRHVLGNASPLPAEPKPGSLGAIVGNFKSVTARRINRVRNTPGAPVWQRNYWEYVVRSTKTLDAIWRYIVDNPARWALDRYHPIPAGPDPRAADLWRLLQEKGDACAHSQLANCGRSSN